MRREREETTTSVNVSLSISLFLSLSLSISLSLSLTLWSDVTHFDLSRVRLSKGAAEHHAEVLTARTQNRFVGKETLFAKGEGKRGVSLNVSFLWLSVFLYLSWSLSISLPLFLLSYLSFSFVVSVSRSLR